MKLPRWLAWWLIRWTMEVTVVRLWWKGMPWMEARRRVAEATVLYMHRNVTPQFGPSPSDTSGGGTDR